MSAKRSSIMRGGGRALFKTVPIYSEADIDVQITSKVTPLKTAMLGKISDTANDVMVEVTLTPSGEITAGLIGIYAAFFSAAMYPGQSIFDPVTDYPMVINSRDGQQLTLTNVAMSTPPPLICAGGKLLFGAAKFTGLRANGAPWSQAGSLYTLAPVAYPGDAAFNKNNIIRQPYVGRWLQDRTGTITATSNASPDVITTAVDHGLLAGDTVTITGVLGDTNVNGTFTVAPTSLSETAFSLYQLGTTTPIAGNGAYVSGGTFIRKGAVPSGTITGTSNASPDVITTAADHGLLAGDIVTIAGVVGDTNVNGTFTVAPTSLTETTFSLYQLGTTTPIDGNAAYVSGGTFTRANLGDSFASFNTEDGFTITPTVSLTQDKVDGVVMDMLIDTIAVKAEAIAVGPTLADVLGMINVQGGNNVIGQDIGALGIPLYLCGAGVYVKLPLATLLATPINYGTGKKRIQKLSWESEMSFGTGGVPVPLLQLSQTPIA